MAADTAARGYGGIDWAAGGAGGAVLGQPLYSVYNEATYDVIWDTYAYQPRANISWWFYRDFGKVNLSASWDREEMVEVRGKSGKGLPFLGKVNQWGSWDKEEMVEVRGKGGNGGGFGKMILSAKWDKGGRW